MILIEPKKYIIVRGEMKNPKELLVSAGLEIGGYAERFIETPEFAGNSSGTKKEVELQLVKFDKDYLVQDILSEIKKAGFGLPEARDAILFAIQVPDVQKEYPVAFLHEPFILPETGSENVIILRSYSGNRYFHMHLFESRWYSHIRFAVVKVNSTI